MRLSGAPAKRPANTADHGARKPIFAGRSGATVAPARSSTGTQAPSEPRRGQLAPPRASTVAAGRRTSAASGPSIRRAPASSQPVQRVRVRRPTPSPSRRASHARSSGDALKARGNTRPLDPTKVGWPRSSHQCRRASGGKRSTAAISAGAAGW